MHVQTKMFSVYAWKCYLVCYFPNCIGQAVPRFRPNMGKTAFAKLEPSCQWFITASPGRSEMDSGIDICGTSSNKIRQIRWAIAGMYKVRKVCERQSSRYQLSTVGTNYLWKRQVFSPKWKGREWWMMTEVKMMILWQRHGVSWMGLV